MRIFFDECVPRPLRNLLPSHEIKTAQQMGWGRLKNGDLIAKAEQAGFEVFVTSDQNLKYQQNLFARKISILVLSTNYWPKIRTEFSKVVSALSALKPGEYREVNLS